MTMDAAAIVVGVDAYTGVAGLDGSVQDALDVTAWLIDVGVPPERINLHIAPVGHAPAPEGVGLAGATRDEIWGTVAGLQQSGAKGERLFVFLSGHGYYLAGSGPIFLCSDYSKTFRNKNLAILRYVDFFQGLSFSDTLFVVDACQNYDVDPGFRSKIQAAGPDDQTVQPNPRNGLMLLCAAEQEQYAPIVDGRGLLTRTLVAALRKAPTALPRVAGDALVFDWATGIAQLDLAQLFRHAVAPDVVTAARNAGQRQNPTMRYFGRLSQEWRFITHTITDLPTVEMTVTAQDLAGLDLIRIGTTPPVFELELPLTTVPSMPFKGFAPAGRRLTADCVPALDWAAEPTNHLVNKVDGPLALHFELSKPLGPGASKSQAPAGRIFLKKGPPRGILAFGVTGPDYAERAAAPPPNLRLDLPEGGPGGLLGRLSGSPLIRLERQGRVGPEAVAMTLSADEIAAQPWRRVAPGAYRLVVDAPWGGAVKMVTVGGERTAVAVPAPDGDAPLRNQLSAEENEQILRRRPRFFAPGIGEIDMGAGFLGLSHLPIWVGGTLLVEWGGIRVEPFSNLPWPEWDQLLVAGRLEGVDLMAARAKLDRAGRGRPDVELLRLALAYAAWAQNDYGSLRALLRLVDGGPRRSTDWRLLFMVLMRSRTDDELEPPLLRWGAGLAGLVAPNTVLPGPASPLSTWALYEQQQTPEPEPEPEYAHA